MAFGSIGAYRAKDSDPQEQAKARKGAFSQAFANRPKMFGGPLAAPEGEEDPGYEALLNQALGMPHSPNLGGEEFSRPRVGGMVQGPGIGNLGEAFRKHPAAPQTVMSKALLQAIQAPAIEAGVSGVDMPGSELPVDPGINPLESAASVGLASLPSIAGVPAQKKSHGISALMKAILGGLRR